MSYEKDITQKMKKGEEVSSRINIPILRYFWQASALAVRKKDLIPNFLGGVSILSSFSNNELRVLSKFMHVREFYPREVIFKEGDDGVGFYFILKGQVDIVADRLDSTSYRPKKVLAKKKSTTKAAEENYENIATLENYDYFGELALLESNSRRDVTAIAKDTTKLIGIFKPDMEELIELHPHVAAKLLQAISLIISNRLRLITDEIRALKVKLIKLDPNG